MPMQSTDPWLSIVPIAESRSSYNGLLVFLFITISTLAAIEIITALPRARCAAVRPGTAAFRTRARHAIPAGGFASRSARLQLAV